jgi:type II secretory pathway component PulJ
MKRAASNGKRAPCPCVTLLELLIAMVIASLLGGMILQMVVGFQSRILTEISRNDLQDRAERLIRFLAGALHYVRMER